MSAGYTERQGGYYGQSSTAGGSPSWSPSAVATQGSSQNATDAARQFFSQYARERPEVVALWAFGIGFLLGWKLKPW